MVTKILVCDDDDGILEMLGYMLEGEGRENYFEQDSERLYDRIEAIKPHLLVIDLWMPVVSGDEIIKRLREADEYIKLPILAISASTDGKKVAMGAGATDYLSKPFDMDEFIGKVEKLISGFQTEAVSKA